MGKKKKKTSVHSMGRMGWVKPKGEGGGTQGAKKRTREEHNTNALTISPKVLPVLEKD